MKTAHFKVDSCEQMSEKKGGGCAQYHPHSAKLQKQVNRCPDDIKWLIIYVLLSRVRSLSRLRSVGLTTKIRNIIEGGPPSMLAENFERNRKKIEDTSKAARAARSALGWT